MRFGVSTNYRKATPIDCPVCNMLVPRRFTPLDHGMCDMRNRYENVVLARPEDVCADIFGPAAKHGMVSRAALDCMAMVLLAPVGWFEDGSPPSCPCGMEEHRSQAARQKLSGLALSTGAVLMAQGETGDWSDFTRQTRYRLPIRCKAAETLKPFAPIPTNFQTYRLKEWISRCKFSHVLCQEKRQPTVAVRLLDCVARAVKEYQASAMPEFVALSYVWGYTMAEPLIGKDLPPTLPHVIKDAITVTLELGYRHLWVDQYCVDQHNYQAKHEQISRMNEVYRAADVTIVAAAGHDAQYGLPLYDRSGPSKQTSLEIIAKLGTFQVTATPVHPREALLGSTWIKRGWTYQESYFSTRILAFTDEQFYYECMSCSSCESLGFEFQTDWFSAWMDSRPRLFLPSGPFLNSTGKIRVNQHPPISKFLGNVERFTARELTYEEDSLNAFGGIIEEHVETEDRDSYSSGLPGLEDGLLRLRREHARGYENTYARIRGVPFSQNLERCFSVWGIPFKSLSTGGELLDLEQMLVLGISWYHRRSLWDGQSRTGVSRARRPGFPSWSWAGWEGAVVYPWKDDYQIGMGFSSLTCSFDILVDNASFMEGQCLGKKSPASSYKLEGIQGSSVFNMRSGHCRLLSFKALVVPAKQFRLRESIRGGREWYIGSRKTRFFLSQRPASPEEFLKALRSWDCVVLPLFRKHVGTGGEIKAQVDETSAFAEDNLQPLYVFLVLRANTEAMRWTRLGVAHVLIQDSGSVSDIGKELGCEEFRVQVTVE